MHWNIENKNFYIRIGILSVFKNKAISVDHVFYKLDLECTEWLQ